MLTPSDLKQITEGSREAIARAEDLRIGLEADLIVEQKKVDFDDLAQTAAKAGADHVIIYTEAWSRIAQLAAHKMVQFFSKAGYRATILSREDSQNWLEVHVSWKDAK